MTHEKKFCKKLYLQIILGFGNVRTTEENVGSVPEKSLFDVQDSFFVWRLIHFGGL